MNAKKGNETRQREEIEEGTEEEAKREEQKDGR